jgi:Flp pilus assembly protein TadD
MCKRGLSRTKERLGGAMKILVVAASSLHVAACASVGSNALSLFDTHAQPQAAPADTRTALQQATEYWGKAYAKNPKDAQNAINYASNLKALGEKQKALAVLQEASQFNPGHRALNSEYGRLALDLDQVSVASKLLEQADDPTNPDWRIISARGTVLAKQGKYHEAIPYYEKALAVAPNQASVLSNLALALAMDGEADKAEPLLKQALAAGGHDARVQQNLALVLGLQGKYDEAKMVAARNLPAEQASANVDLVQQIVQLQPKPMAPPVVAKAASGDQLTATLKGTTSDDGASLSGWATHVAATPTTANP